MKRTTRLFWWALALIIVWGGQSSAQACATCFGAADSPLTKGLNWGIGSLLVVILMVLGGVASFFVYMIRRSNSLSETSDGPGLTEATGETQ